MTSLCDTCDHVREVSTARSRFLLCQLSLTNPAYPKYPPQLVVRCDCYRLRNDGDEDAPGDRRGTTGELWYVRLLPPLLPDLAHYHVAFTTPYILMASQNEWSQFLRRALVGSVNEATGLHRFFKYGPDPNSWNEFVFKAYHHHRSDAIFLAGIPDLKATLPHA